MNTKQLRQLMPKDAQDVAAARELVSLGPETLAPVVPEMLRHLKDCKSPVAEVYCDFFASHGERFADEVARALGKSKVPDLKNAIVSRVLPAWSRESVSLCTGALLILVSHTDTFDTDLLCIHLLAKHKLADVKWLREWLEFKQKRLERLTLVAQEVASVLNSSTN